MQAAVWAASAHYGRVDILVNNAATNFPALFHDMPQKHWDRIMEVNLRGTVLCTKAVLPAMMRQGRGHIINISSVVTRELRHEPFTGIAYDVSKAAMNRLTLGLAEELKPCGIAVNALMPDNTDSDGWAYLNPGIDRSGWEVIPEVVNKKARMEAVPLKTGTGQGLKNHVKNHLECIVARNPETNTTPEIGAHIAKFSQLGNIAYRTGKKLVWNGTRFTNDDEANRYLLPNYRNPWKLPTV